MVSRTAGGDHREACQDRPKDFKRLLAERDGSRCGICLTEYEARYLQVDHKVPYEVGGEGGGESTPEGFQLLCGSCNRAKSWSCEHCNNWIDDRQPRVCRSCYWANPENYGHVAQLLIRRIELTWTGDETHDYDQLAAASRRDRQQLHAIIKGILRKSLGQRK